MVHYLEVNDKRVPQKMVNQWKLLFVKGLPVMENYHVPLDKENIVITAAPAVTDQPKEQPESVTVEPKPLLPVNETVEQGVRELDDHEFLEYLDGNGAWPYARYT
jgi:hypothetical protein